MGLNSKNEKGLSIILNKVAGNEFDYVMSLKEYKETYLDLIKKCKGKYEVVDVLPDELTKEPDRLHEYINYKYYKWLPKFLKKDIDFVNEIVSVDAKMYAYIPKSLQSNAKIITTAIKGNNNNIYDVPSKVMKDKQVVLKVIDALNEGYNDILSFVPNDMLKDEEVVLAAVKKGASIKLVPQAIKDEYEIALESVKHLGSNIKYLKDEYKNNVNIVSNAIKNDPQSMMFASKNLRSDKSFILLAIEKYHTNVAPYVDESLKDDEDIKNSVNRIDESETL